MTLYLKYRPQRISDLDLTEVKEVLSKVLLKKELPHAFLFTGPWGTGKTSAARILAKAVNCENRKNGEPCNECEMCKAVTEGSATDVIEIDAASNRGIDEIRELREKVRLAPMRAKYKVYIIDEVHMLTTEAANALLKTLEEPPEHTMFILCTTEPEKMLETVKSRCAWIKFKKPTREEAIASLEHVVVAEKAKYDKNGLDLVAQAAKGSFRDGTKILEQVIMTRGEVTEQAVKEILGWLDRAEPMSFLELVRGNKTAEALSFVAKLLEDGVNLRSWVERVVEMLRGELINEAMTGKLAKDRKDLLLQEIAGMEKVYVQMKTTAVPSLPLELFVVENVKVASGKPQQVVSPPQPVKAEVKVEEKVEKTAPQVEAVKEVEIIQVETVEEEVVFEPSKDSGRGKFKLDDVTTRWQDIMKQVRPMNHSVEALLRSTRPMDFDGEALTLEVFYKFHKDKLETEKCRSIVEGAVAEVFGVRPVKLYLRLGDKKGKKEEVSGVVEEDIVKAAEAIFKVEAV